MKKPVGAARTRRVRAAVATAVLCLALPALAPEAKALLAPHYYEQARREAASVIVLEISAVTPPEGAFGQCQVAGIVRRVERGTAFAAGQAATIGVPCATPQARPPLGGTIYQDMARLKAAPYGRAYLDAAGGLALSQYEALDALP
ncbi:hypothetical protein J5J86_11455 [Aquabacter sp. L1I39]|uniref:hypothetical protein n=1 Tax=Aquabacter sp. L1I39 TaxID=2820278 RepID=UPI001ADA0315|nr:hypothetical protein [Aquabacter sp. L1I39]QTL05852.1 hypothetical protein J5J86_11455 [Aquabacter sp. L1I39]